MLHAPSITRVLLHYGISRTLQALETAEFNPYPLKIVVPVVFGSIARVSIG